ncbi:Fpg/Nei family DNA glycosylase [Amycolatopsis thermoflava]|uniref:Fpg/Nei family DNA glycosylase n=1 Tax=Amycolatopsis thermoflava TaxID=84480 RepID=UPI00365EE80D
MPEGHTLHRLARLHQRRYAGAPVGVSSPQGRFASEAALLDGQVMLKAEAYGKHLFHDFGPLGSVHVHLGLYGTFTEAKLPETPPVGQVRLRLTGRTHWTDLRGPTRCELLTPDEVDAIKARLGPDPLRRDARPDEAWQRISASRTSIAALLMDQKVVSGIGNVYRAEVLFRHRINPMVPGRALDHVQWKEMWTDLVALMRKGVRIGRIDTVDDEHLPEVTGRAPRQDRHGGEVYVYRRTGQPCLVCGTPIAHTELAGRNLYWCPVCQAA